MSLIGEALPLDAWQGALLPWFAQLCRDNNWRVRRAAALDLPRLATNLQQLQRRAAAAAAGSGDGYDSGSGACSCSSGAHGGACGAGPACANAACTAHEASARCTPIPAGAATGGCAHVCTEVSGSADARHVHHGHGRHRGHGPGFVSASLPASVWSVHAQQPRPGVAAGKGGAVSMGKHPLSSSLLVDAPRGLESQGSASSSSSSASLGSCPPEPAGPAAAADGCGTDGAAAGGTEAASGLQQQEAAASGQGGDDGAKSAEADADAAAASCQLAQEDLALHTCWVVLRECIDCVTADSSHWVRVTALSGLGACLLAVPPCQLSGVLLGRFVAMGSSTTAIYDISVALACAQSLGAVASRLGPSRWADVR
jgi:hypothetical protein